MFVVQLCIHRYLIVQWLSMKLLHHRENIMEVYIYIIGCFCLCPIGKVDLLNSYVQPKVHNLCSSLVLAKPPNQASPHFQLEHVHHVQLKANSKRNWFTISNTYTFLPQLFLYCSLSSSNALIAYQIRGKNILHSFIFGMKNCIQIHSFS